jgi:tight adherence protein B
VAGARGTVGVGVLTAVACGVLAAVPVVLGSGPGPADRLRRALGPDLLGTGEEPGSGRQRPSVRNVISQVRRGIRRLHRDDDVAAPSDPDVAGLAEQLAALSRAGLPWVRVWQAVADTPGPMQPLCMQVATRLGAGGTAAEGLRDVPGPASVRWLAVACDVAERAGAPVADVLERFAGAVRADVAASSDRDAALAGPRATATVLAWLPLGGVALGLLIGADPIGTLIGTTPGRVCLVTGLTLWTVGRRWTVALIRRAERAGR